MNIGALLSVTKPSDLRRWFLRNHQSQNEIWLVQYKKATKKPSIDYMDAVDEALCFGWIDSLTKSLDSERYAIRFSPRRPKSKWTEANKQRALKMLAAGRMTQAGRDKMPQDLMS